MFALARARGHTLAHPFTCKDLTLEEITVHYGVLPPPCDIKKGPIHHLEK